MRAGAVPIGAVRYEVALRVLWCSERMNLRCITQHLPGFPKVGLLTFEFVRVGGMAICTLI